MKITYEKEIDLISQILLNLGASEEESLLVAKILSEGDVRGFGSHGILRLPYIMRGIRRGTIKPKTEVTVEVNKGSIVLVNGNHGLGHYVFSKAMELGMEKAKEYGAAIIGVHDTNHFGIAGYYSEMASRENLVSLIMTTTDPAVHPFGGSEAILGTNALSIGIPHSNYNILLDMATSTAARGKILEASRRNIEIPQGWAIDKEGNPTTDPLKAIEGVLSPFGGPKGYALSFMISILAGPIVGAEAGRQVHGTLNPLDYSTKGDMAILIDPFAFVGRQEFEKKISEFISDIKSSRKAPGTSEIMLPGEVEYRKFFFKQKTAYEITDATINEIRELSKEYNFYEKISGNFENA